MSRKSYARTDRLRSLLLEILAEQLENIDDPQLGFAFFSAVEVDKDLNRAHVFFSSLDWGDATGEALRQAQADTAQALSEHKGSFRRAMAKQAHLRRIPELVFLPDESFQHGAHIEETLRQINSPSPSPLSSGAGRSERGYTLQTLIVTAVLVLMAVAAGVIVVAITGSANRDLENQQPSIDGPCNQVEIYDAQLAAASVRGSNAGVEGSGVGCVPACVAEWHIVPELDENGNQVWKDMDGNIVMQGTPGATRATDGRGFIKFQLNVSPDRLIDTADEMALGRRISAVSQLGMGPAVHVYVGHDTVHGSNGPIPVVQPGTAQREGISLETSEGEEGVRVSEDQKSCVGYDNQRELIIFEAPPSPTS